MSKSIKITYFRQIKANFRKKEDALTHRLFFNSVYGYFRIIKWYRHFFIITITSLSNYLFFMVRYAFFVDALF